MSLFTGAAGKQLAITPLCLAEGNRKIIGGNEAMISRPSENEYASYYSRYISLVSGSDVLSVLETQLEDITRLVGSVTPERETYRYAPDKWSIRQVLGHLVDGERVFGYRAFCISRGESALLPKFDENAYVAESHYNERTLSGLLAEFTIIRKSNLAFLCQLTETDWKRMGTVSNNPVSVRALAFIMAGHVRHHYTLLHTSYDVSLGA
jgi:hypothetical protein